MTENGKKIKAEKKLNIFLIKNCNLGYLSHPIHKVHPSYRRSLQLSKEAIQHFKTFVGHFALLDPDPDSESGSTDPIESGSNPDPEP
jgi:hypothetical protein